MKRLLAIFINLFFGFQMILLAQKTVTNEGVYLSANDFNAGKILYTKVQGKKYKFRLHDIFHTSTLEIIIGDSANKLNKDSIFGYCDRENCYRFYNKIVYRIINPSEKILLYSRTSLGGYKNSQTVTTYFFSADANTPIYALSRINIKNEFQNDPEFHELLDLYFHTDDQLLNYDNYNKMYKLNRVYQISKQIKIQIN